MTKDELNEVNLQLQLNVDMLNANMMLDDYLLNTKILFGTCSAVIASHSGNAIKNRMRGFGSAMFAVKEAKDFETKPELKDECRYVATKFSDMIEQGQIRPFDMTIAFRQARNFFKT